MSLKTTSNFHRKTLKPVIHWNGGLVVLPSFQTCPDSLGIYLVHLVCSLSLRFCTFVDKFRALWLLLNVSSLVVGIPSHYIMLVSSQRLSVLLCWWNSISGLPIVPSPKYWESSITYYTRKLLILQKFMVFKPVLPVVWHLYPSSKSSKNSLQWSIQLTAHSCLPPIAYMAIPVYGMVSIPNWR